MKFVKVPCVRCHKFFDFELYSGLCPNCGLAHRRPGYATMEGYRKLPEIDSAADEYKKHLEADARRGVAHGAHKDSKIDPHEAQMKRDVEEYPKHFTDSTLVEKRDHRSYRNTRVNGNNRAGKSARDMVVAVITWIVIVVIALLALFGS